VAAARRNVIAALEATVHRVLDHLGAELRDLGLTPGEVNALAQLDAGAPVTVAQLGAATGQRPSTLTGVLDRLERRGLVERSLNPRDRRSFTVALTGPGAEAAGRVRQAFDELERRVARASSRHALDGFHEVLDRLDELTARGR
jgi:DNA-binding MarR family transcriptional regulator